MGFLGWIIGAGVAGHIIKKARQNARKAAEEKAEQDRRRNTPCRFVDGFSEYEFEQMVKTAGRNIRRLSEISVDGPVVYGVVQSQSGISEWSFKLDFNDYGHITGTYWLSSDNDASNIPNRLGELIQSAINNYSSEEDEEEDFASEFDYRENGYCFYCGKKQTVSNAVFCSYCGKRLR